MVYSICSFILPLDIIIPISGKWVRHTKLRPIRVITYSIKLTGTLTIFQLFVARELTSLPAFTIFIEKNMLTCR